MSDAYKYPILNFDPEEGFINPKKLISKLETMPKKIVLSFYSKQINRMLEEGLLELITNLRSEMGEHPLYKFKDSDIGLFTLGVGAPLAVGLLEEIIALGGEDFIACGSAGVLADFEVGSLIIPNEAIREEGTSYHYIKPSRTIKLEDGELDELIDYLKSLKISFTVGKVWTTDAIYRETRKKVEAYKKENVLAVEMEFSALLAICKYYKVKFVQILSAGDSLAKEEWDSRRYKDRTDFRYTLIEICKNYLLNKE